MPMPSPDPVNFRRFERFSLLLVVGSLLLVPAFLFVHPPVGQMARDFLLPQRPEGAPLAEVMLLIIAIVATTVAPRQLFFQQSDAIDMRITPHFIRCERIDLVIGVCLVVIGGVAMMSFASAAFAGHPEFGHFVDAGAVAERLDKYAGHVAGAMFAIAPIDACVIGASAVSLSTA
jgi:Mn2+/Fe2+ NRAMP family transporter